MVEEGDRVRDCPACGEVISYYSNDCELCGADIMEYDYPTLSSNTTGRGVVGAASNMFGCWVVVAILVLGLGYCAT